MAWDPEMIAEGQALVRRCLRHGRPGPYQIQAAINAVHAGCPHGGSHGLAADRGALRPAPRCRLELGRGAQSCGRRGEVEGAAVGLALVEALPLEPYYLWRAIRADLLVRAGRKQKADSAYRAAIARSDNVAERRYLERMHAAVARG